MSGVDQVAVVLGSAAVRLRVRRVGAVRRAPSSGVQHAGLLEAGANVAAARSTPQVVAPGPSSAVVGRPGGARRAGSRPAPPGRVVEDHRGRQPQAAGRVQPVAQLDGGHRVEAHVLEGLARADALRAGCGPAPRRPGPDELEQDAVLLGRPGHPAGAPRRDAAASLFSVSGLRRLRSAASPRAGRRAAGWGRTAVNPGRTRAQSTSATVTTSRRASSACRSAVTASSGRHAAGRRGGAAGASAACGPCRRRLAEGAPGHRGGRAGPGHGAARPARPGRRCRAVGALAAAAPDAAIEENSDERVQLRVRDQLVQPAGRVDLGREHLGEVAPAGVVERCCRATSAAWTTAVSGWSGGDRGEQPARPRRGRRRRRRPTVTRAPSAGQLGQQLRHARRAGPRCVVSRAVGAGARRARRRRAGRALRRRR